MPRIIIAVNKSLILSLLNLVRHLIVAIIKLGFS